MPEVARSASARSPGLACAVAVQYAIPRPNTFTREIGAEVESKVAEINGRYADEGIKPVEYFNKHISFDERLALYR